MADIQCAMAGIRQGKKIDKRKTTGRKYNGLPYSIGRQDSTAHGTIWQNCIFSTRTAECDLLLVLNKKLNTTSYAGF